jgi:glycine cleavage system H protein
MKNLKFHPEHAWISVSGHHGTIGISDYAQKLVGQVMDVGLPEIDTEIKPGEPLGSLESSKASIDVIAPVSGTVIETNRVLEKDPQLINSFPYEEGWLVKVILKKPSELNELMDKAAYEEFIRFKESIIY